MALDLSRHDGTETRRLVDELTSVYVDAYSDPPYSYGPDEVAEFHARLDRTFDRDGFTLVAGRVDGQMVGFSYGYRFGPDGWWKGVTVTPPPPEMQGLPKFAVIELVVVHEHRGHGYARLLVDTLLADRPDPYATLLANRSAPAHTMYQRWGWTKVGEVQSYAHWPVDDALALRLPARQVAV